VPESACGTADADAPKSTRLLQGMDWLPEHTREIENREVSTMRGQSGMKELITLLGAWRAGFSWWRGWLGLWLAWAMALPLFGQGRPDIVWMRGGHAG